MMLRLLFIVTALSGAISVAMGAFAAHGLRGKIEAASLHAFETGVAYQMSHTLALFGVCILMQVWGAKPGLYLSAWSFLLGILLFSGSLYGLALTDTRWLGPITPIGGVAFIVGWLALGFALWKNAG